MRLCALLFLFSLAAGCTRGPLVRDAPDLGGAADYPNHSAGYIVAQLASRSAPPAYRSGARIKIRRGGRTDNASLTLVARGDSVSAVVRGPLGIEVGRALATADSVYLYDGLKGRILYGPAAAAGPYVPGFDTPSGAALRGAILGDAPPIPSAAALAAPGTGGAADGPAYRFSFTRSDGREVTWTVDPSLWQVVRYDVTDPDGASVLRQTFGAFDTVDGRVLPRRVTLARPADDTSVEIEHRDLQIGTDAAPSFRAPASAPRTRFD